jgi:hypothetical protein
MDEDLDESKKFSSFDILWFDIESKVREQVLEICRPMNDHIFETRDQALKLEV